MSRNKKASTGERLKWVRKQKGLNQTQMAEALGVSLRGYQNYERAEADFPVDLMGPIHRMGVLPAWVLNGTGDPWIDEAHTPEHLRVPTKPDHSKAELMERARAWVDNVLESYTDLKPFKPVYWALVEMAEVEGVDIQHVASLCQAFDAALKQVAAHTLSARRAEMPDMDRAPRNEPGFTQNFNSPVEQVGGRDVVNVGRKKRR